MRAEFDLIEAGFDKMPALSGNGSKLVRVNSGGTALEAFTATYTTDGDTLSTGFTFPNTGLHVLDSDASHDLILKPGSNITADRTLTITTGDADRTISLSGNLTFPAAFTLSGAYAFTGTLSNTTTVTFPTTGTLATLDGSETLTNKTLTTPALGVATATSINKVAITAPATSATLTLADGSSLVTSGAYSVTLTLTGATNVTLPTSGTLAVLGANTFTGAQALGNNNITGIKQATFNSVIDNGNSGTSKTIDWTTGHRQKITMTGSCTFTFTDPSAPCNLVLMVTQDATGSRTIAWPANCYGASGSVDLTGTANSVDIIVLYFDGTNYYVGMALPDAQAL